MSFFPTKLVCFQPLWFPTSTSHEPLIFSSVFSHFFCFWLTTIAFQNLRFFQKPSFSQTFDFKKNTLIFSNLCFSNRFFHEIFVALQNLSFFQLFSQKKVCFQESVVFSTFSFHDFFVVFSKPAIFQNLFSFFLNDSKSSQSEAPLLQ